MAKNSVRDYAVALFEITAGLKGAALERALEEFVKLLYRKQKLKQADRIIAAFLDYGRAQEGVVLIDVTSARALDEADLKKIKKSFGTKVEATEKVNPTLLGGFVVKTKEAIFDGSIAKQLQRLKQALV